MKTKWTQGENCRTQRPVFTCAAVGDPACVPPKATPEQRGVFSHLYSIRANAAEAAFTLVEVMIGTVVTTTMLISLYVGFTFGFREMRLGRQEARATQILQEKMEVVRLLNWDQVANLPGYIPTSFTEPFYATDPTNSLAGGFNYTGTVLVTNAPIAESYSSDLRLIQVTVNWSSGSSTYTRTMSAYVSQWGMQNYVY